MEINGHGKPVKVNLPKPNITSTSAGEGVSASGEVEQSKPQSLTERLQGDAKVREQLLVEVKAKIEAGEYATRAAAVETAQQIVESN